MMTTPARMPAVLKEKVDVFIDYENVRKLARAQFCGITAEPHKGMVDPVKLAAIVVSKRRRPSELRRVHVYRGRPVPQHQPQAAMYFDRHAQRWLTDPKCTLIKRPLKYSMPDASKPEVRVAQEKGIDVSLAIDVAKASMSEDELDAIIIFSTDTDLLPAIEFARSNGMHTEVAAWEGTNPLRFSGGLSSRLWCHNMNENEFAQCCTDNLFN